LMRLADYVAKFISDLGVGHVFGVTGGGAMHLNDAFGNQPGLEFIPVHHEQAAAMAAEGHARVTGLPGVALLTTGPGGTNALTGVCGAWIDSIPMILISGQVTTDTLIADSPLRQFGVQEVDIIALARPVTKYAVLVDEPEMIRYHLEKALHLATTGRSGPVWLDIPLDVQNAKIVPENLASYSGEKPKRRRSAIYQEGQIEKCAAMLTSAKRPVLIAGNGIRLAKGEDAFRELTDKLGIPVITSWNASDLLDASHPNNIGRSGLFGDRAGNFTVQNADLLLIVGSRMSIPQTGHNAALFARGARQIMVDIDEAELVKPNLRPDLAIVSDARQFLEGLNARLGNAALMPEAAAWLETCQALKRRYPVVQEEYRELKDKVNSFHFIDRLSSRLGSGAIVVTDMGTSFTCTMQTFSIKHGQRLFTSSGLAAMGFGLPGAIGACMAGRGRKTVCVSGDGGFMFNLQELQTVAHFKLPLAIFILANEGYLTIKHMQETHFGRFVGSHPASNVTCPDFVKVAQAFNIQAFRMGSAGEVDSVLEQVLACEGPVLCQVDMPPLQPLIPRVQTMKGEDGRPVPTPIEDMYPFLDRDEFHGNMIVPPVT
jgi:acetolactate synthase-1/2/3 large subunit